MDWYEPLPPTTTLNVATGYCHRCNVWWMGGHACFRAGVSPQMEARIREIVQEVIAKYGPALDRLGDE